MASSSLPVQNFVLGGDPLSLDRIRAILTRLEDTIIFSLIERAQFAHNPKAYRRGEIKELKDRIANPDAYASAAPAATSGGGGGGEEKAEEKKEEEEEEASDEDMGFGLFD